MVFSNAQKSLDQRQVLPQDVSQSVLAISDWLKDSIDNNLSVKRLELIDHIVLTNFETYFNDCIKSRQVMLLTQNKRVGMKIFRKSSKRVG